MSALAVKCTKENERKRKQRARIASDPDSLANCRKNEREVYKRRKADGRLKPIAEQNKRALAKQRKKWQISSKQYYARKKAEEKAGYRQDDNLNKVSQQKEEGKRKEKASEN
jgi:hypothetical protein